MKYRSKETAIGSLKQFFSKIEQDSITLEEAIVAWGGRENYSNEQNENWVRNKLTHLKYHNLVKPVYKLRNGRRAFDKIQLTLEGKKAIGRIEVNEKEIIKEDGDQSINRKITIEDIMKVIPQIKNENPFWEITFEVRPKDTN